MRRLALPILLLCSASISASTAPNPADYMVTIHVTSSRVQEICSQSGSSVGCVPLLMLHATVDGQKYELQGSLQNKGLPNGPGASEHLNSYSGKGFLALGDYKAKLLPGNAKDPSVPYYIIKNYEILFPDGRIAEFQVVGQAE